MAAPSATIAVSSATPSVGSPVLVTVTLSCATSAYGINVYAVSPLVNAGRSCIIGNPIEETTGAGSSTATRYDAVAASGSKVYKYEIVPTSAGTYAVSALIFGRRSDTDAAVNIVPTVTSITAS